MHTTCKQDESEHLSSCDLYIVDENEQVEFTMAGLNYYRPYFQRLGLKFSRLHTANKLRKALTLIRPLEVESKRPLQVSSYDFLERRRQDAQSKLDLETAFRLELMLFDLKGRGMTDVK